MAWVAADAFIGPGVTVGDGAVVGARSVVLKDVPCWAVVAGNPGKIIKYRSIQSASRSNAAADVVPSAEVAEHKG
jgi:putative colanic acid biosynthesis acetyltransferase WcaF